MDTKLSLYLGRFVDKLYLLELPSGKRVLAHLEIYLRPSLEAIRNLVVYRMHLERIRKEEGADQVIQKVLFLKPGPAEYSSGYYEFPCGPESKIVCQFRPEKLWEEDWKEELKGVGS